MKVLLIIAAVLAVFFIIRKILAPKRDTDDTGAASARATGCGSGLGCQYMNLGKAREAGKGEDITFCRYYNDYVRRRDNCDGYYPHGCANGMCDHANHSDGVCYCNFYQTNVQPKETCPDYLDFFDTEIGKDFAKSIKEGR